MSTSDPLAMADAVARLVAEHLSRSPAGVGQAPPAATPNLAAAAVSPTPIAPFLSPLGLGTSTLPGGTPSVLGSAPGGAPPRAPEVPSGAPAIAGWPGVASGWDAPVAVPLVSPARPEHAAPYFLDVTPPTAGADRAADRAPASPEDDRLARDLRRGGAFDAHAVKREFPILRERVNGRPLVWLDNAATTQKPAAVIERLRTFYEHENSNIHRAAHTLAARATDAYEEARDIAARFLGASSPREIVFVRGATEAINLVAKAWGERHVQAGDEIVVSWLEHHANVVPWQQLCERTGARLRVAPVDDDGQIVLDAYERLLSRRTKLVAFTQVSNALGTITPVGPMVEMAHRHGARVLVDGAQAVSHMPVDVRALGCDWYVLSGHKVFAPTGIGVLYGREEVLEETPPWQGGGNMIADVTFERTVYQAPPARFEAGTGNIADAVGLGAALEWLSALGLPNVSRHEHELLEAATARLLQIPGLRIVGTAREKAAVVSFILDGHRPEDVGAALDREGIAVRAGHHCAQPILRRFGLESTVRASFAPYNTREDVDALAGALRRIQAGGPPR